MLKLSLKREETSDGLSHLTTLPRLSALSHTFQCLKPSLTLTEIDRDMMLMRVSFVTSQLSGELELLKKVERPNSVKQYTLLKLQLQKMVTGQATTLS